MKNIPEAFLALKDFHSPKILGEVNDQFIKIAKILGEEIPWHQHDHEDELFFIIKGSLVMEIANEPPFEMHEGDFYVVKKGVQHKVSSKEACHVVLIESKTTKHTGDVKSEITKSIDEQY